VIELELAHVAFGDANLNQLAFEVHALDCSLEKPDTPQARSYRLRTMPKLQHSGTCLEKKRTEKKEIVATDERDFYIVPTSNQSIESAGSGKSADSSA
jgi:hypothetical protein